ncbi:peptidase M8 [Streptomyces sp. WAC 06725]|uniref:S8 family serine peptidase n=1 Tax=Streptomyces sp. WAC 06725 TaxID=2203209 RepID=UPI000F74558B|nr:S8 family serine peptidase [Streptomyces sp. WAC 06725]RSO45702.1 peptidase M8 [Streptomyces sp. WAC 06725]
MSFARALRAVGGVAVTGALLFGAAPVATADETRDAQWPLQSFVAEQVWKESTGKGVTVAVVDDAVKGDHPDLRGNVLPGKDLVNGGTADRESVKDHGTGMASNIAGHGHGAGNADGVKGLAPDAKILPIAVPENGSSDSLGEAVRYAADHGASVINLSLGPSYISETVRQALAYAAKKDVLIVAASGNEATNDIGPLGKAPGVLSVGAVDQYGKVWEKSNFGEGLLLTAPGVHIRSAAASEPYQQASGTSDAAAYVSAASALLRSKFPNLTAGQIANRLVKTAGMAPKLEGTQLPDPHYGYGFIRPLRALKEDIPAGPKNGPLKAPEAQPSAGADGANAVSGGSQQAGVKKDDGLSIGVVVGIAAGVLIVVVIIVVVVVSRQKNRRNGPPPGGPGGWGGPGGPGGAPCPPNAYQQQAGPPGAYPSYPPQQPPPPQ